MRSLGWAIIWHDWWPFRRSGQTHTQKEDHVKAQGEGGHLQAKERGLRRCQSCWHFDLWILASRIVKKIFLSCCLSYPVYSTFLWQLKQLHLLHQHTQFQEGIVSVLALILSTEKPFHCCLADLEGWRNPRQSLEAERKQPSPLLTHAPLDSVITACEANLWDN